MKQSQIYNQKGFTLIEALIAIFIFSVALVSLITISARGVMGVSQARNQATAQFLAQEGIEMFRNVRDTAFINSTTADLETILDPCGDPNICAIDFINSNAQMYNLDTGVSAGLELDPISGRYITVNGGTFRREIYYTQTLSVNQLVLHSVVTWNNGSIPRKVHLSTVLTNWGQQ